MPSVISVENLSKKYIIGHQAQGRYTSLSDVLANGAKRFTHKLAHPFATPQNDQTHEEFWALNNVSFDIQQGDRVGIIGRNGAGKSTLLKILSRITEPTTGRVSIRGRVASLLEVGTGFHPELSGRENVYLNGAILGMSKADIKNKFDAIIAFAEVEKFLDTPVKRYSSGMYVRLAFAVAAHLEPDIMIIDEVLAVGDARFQKKCLGKMEEVGAEGRTVLFVSHSLPMVSSLCTKGILLDAGQVIKTGTASDVVNFYNRGENGSSDIDFSDRKIGDEYAKLLSVAVLDSSGSSVAEVKINENIRVAATFEILRDIDRELMPKFHFAFEDGRYAFITAGTKQMRKYRPGKYRAYCHIPANFLNQGMYSVGIGLVSYEPTRIVHFHEEPAIAFNVVDPLIDVPTRAKGAPLSSLPGAVRPLLDWTVEEINSAYTR
jgi:lipopolysaccharide transport system ATP-binding protein